MTHEEIYSAFSAFLEQRLSYKRRSVEFSLVPYSVTIVEVIARAESDVYIRFLLDEKIDEILTDCEIYYEMSVRCACDALGELSNYAAIYSDDMSSQTYKKICRLIKQICVSYPAN